MSNDNNEQPESRHSVTERRRCYEMEKKYGKYLKRCRKLKHNPDSRQLLEVVNK
jgi:hypothetical protein